MSAATETNSAVTAYLDAVRLYLSDLPEWDVEDLMADIEQHVVEVASEWDGPLTSILGDPISFVEEYRNSAEVPRVDDIASTPPLVDRVVRAVETARRGATWMSLRAFAKEARPGWWALRGFMAASVVMFIISSTSRTTMVDPFVFGPKGVVLSVVAMVLSVHLGRRSQSRTWRRRLAIVSNVAVLAAVFVMGQQVNDTPFDHVAFAASELEWAFEAGRADALAHDVTSTELARDAQSFAEDDLRRAIDAFQACTQSMGVDARALLEPESGVTLSGDLESGGVASAIDECLEQSDLRHVEAAYLAELDVAVAPLSGAAERAENLDR